MKETKMGRPKAEIDIEKLDNLCAIQCSLVEIAEAFNVSGDTIENFIKSEFNTTFSEYFNYKRQKGLRSLRAKMYQLAINGNVPILIHLSKQKAWLNMSENHLVQIEDTAQRLEKLRALKEKIIANESSETDSF